METIYELIILDGDWKSSDYLILMKMAINTWSYELIKYKFRHMKLIKPLCHCAHRYLFQVKDYTLLDYFQNHMNIKYSTYNNRSHSFRVSAFMKKWLWDNNELSPVLIKYREINEKDLEFYYHMKRTLEM